ncbi:MAG: GTP pyrophosphokinase family protein [Limosilactobacillus sp.]
MDIYGHYHHSLVLIQKLMTDRLEELSQRACANGQAKLYEHLISRIKSNASMVEKCQRKGYPVTTESALRRCHDAIGFRIVCNFIDDIPRNLQALKQADWCAIVKEKDYITHAKPNGYRSYHVILDLTTPYEDVDGHTPGHYYVEIQLRTIAMDSWASLEHEMKYKHNIKDPERIGRELKKCADQLASCDIQMQTIRQLIHENDKE